MNANHDLKTALRERVEKLLSPQTRELLGISYDCADVSTVIIGAAAAPCFLFPKNGHGWELTCPWWSVEIAEDPTFESKVLAHVARLSSQLAQAFAPPEKAAVN